jgi:hypothetical protein
MTHAVASSFSNQLRPITASTRRYALSLWKGGHCRKSLNNLVIKSQSCPI